MNELQWIAQARRIFSPRLKAVRSHTDNEYMRLRLLACAAALAALSSLPATAQAACPTIEWDPETKTMSTTVAADDQIEGLGVMYRGTEHRNWNYINFFGCERPEQRDMLHAVITADRPLTIGLGDAAHSARDGATVTITTTKSLTLSIAHDRGKDGATVPIRVVPGGFDLNGDSTPEFRISTPKLTQLTIVGYDGADVVDLRDLTKQPWGVGTEVEYRTEYMSSKRRTIRVHDNAFTIRQSATWTPYTIEVTGSKPSLLLLGKGADIVTLGSGDDLVSSPGGNDIVRLGPGNDKYLDDSAGELRPGRVVKLYGGPGNDHLGFAGDNGLIDAGPGNDRISTTGPGNTLLGGTGNDRISWFKGYTKIDAGPGNDFLLPPNQTPAQAKLQRTNCGLGNDLLRFPIPGAHNCERIQFP